MAEKVASVEEQMKTFRAEIKKKTKEFEKGLTAKNVAVKKARHRSYSDVVREKVEKDGCSYSGLKKFVESPLTYAESLVTERKPDTPAMFLGKVTHKLALEPKEFIETYFIVPEKISRQSNEGKAKYLLYQEMAGNRIILDEETYNKAVLMSEALWKDDDARVYMEAMTKTEKWLNFVHKETGLKCRGIVDMENEEEDSKVQYFIGDLKTAQDASFDGFTRDAAKMGYNIQSGTYTTGYKTKWKFPDYINIVVETKAPYNVNVFRASSEYIRKAQEEFHNIMMAFKYCLDNDLWHKSYNFLRAQALHYDELNLPYYYKSKYKAADKIENDEVK